MEDDGKVEFYQKLMPNFHIEHMPSNIISFNLKIQMSQFNHGFNISNSLERNERNKIYAMNSGQRVFFYPWEVREEDSRDLRESLINIPMFPDRIIPNNTNIKDTLRIETFGKKHSALEEVVDIDEAD